MPQEKGVLAERAQRKDESEGAARTMRRDRHRPVASNGKERLSLDS
jgi:hypothetical protein